MTSGWRLKLISSILLFIVISHNACSRFNSTDSDSANETPSTNGLLSSRIQQDKTQFADSSLPLHFVSFKRVPCNKTSVPGKTLRLEEPIQKWLLTTTTRLASGACDIQKIYVEQVYLFRASQLAIFNGEAFKQFAPQKEALNNENLAAVCKPQGPGLDIGHSKLSGLVILWNKTLKLWETRLDFSAFLESDNLTTQGPYGLWGTDHSVFLFNTARTLAPESEGLPQRQKMDIEISRTPESPGLLTAILNYSFKVYGNHRHEIVDAPMNCWVDLARLD